MSSECSVAVSRAMPFYETAKQAVSSNLMKHANVLFDTALFNLGDAYYRPGTLDHTGTHLMIAWDAQRKGELGRAAYIKRRYLEERLELCGVAIKSPLIKR